MTKAAGYCPQPIEGHVGRSVETAGQYKLLEVDLLFSGGSGHKTSALTLIDSGASHNFLSEKIAIAAGLCIDRLCSLNVKLVDGENMLAWAWHVGYRLHLPLV